MKEKIEINTLNDHSTSPENIELASFCPCCGIAYRHAEIGRCVKKKFADCLEKDLEELRRPSKDT